MNASPIRNKLSVRNKNVEATRNLKGKVKVQAKKTKPTKKLQIYKVRSIKIKPTISKKNLLHCN